MHPHLGGLAKGALAGLILAPVVWFLLGRPGFRGPADSDPLTPADANRPRPSLRPADVNVLRPEPLDSAERARGENVLRRLRERWRQEDEAARKAEVEGRFGCGTRSPGIFHNEWLGGATELRLFALGYPEVAEGWAQQAAEVPQSPGRERWMGVQALGHLASAGWGAAESVLVRLCRYPGEKYFRHLPQYLLLATDRAKEHRALFLALAREGDYPAVEGLSMWFDPEVKVFLEEAKTRWKNRPWPEGGIHWYAEESLLRIKALESDAWGDFCRNTILEQEYAVGDWSRVQWALRIAKDRRASWLEKTLRHRITAMEQTGHVQLASSGGRDDRFDLMLLTLAGIGGELHEQERSYLRRFGYACEPRRRLTEILEEKYYPR